MVGVGAGGWGDWKRTGCFFVLFGCLFVCCCLKISFKSYTSHFCCIIRIFFRNYFGVLQHATFFLALLFLGRCLVKTLASPSQAIYRSETCCFLGMFVPLWHLGQQLPGVFFLGDLCGGFGQLLVFFFLFLSCPVFANSWCFFCLVFYSSGFSRVIICFFCFVFF